MKFKKKKKTKNRNSSFISSQTESGQAEKMNKKIRFGYCFYPTQARTFPKKFKKNSKKIQKKPKKRYSGSISSQNGLVTAEKVKNKITFQVPFLADPG